MVLIKVIIKQFIFKQSFSDLLEFLREVITINKGIIAQSFYDTGHDEGLLEGFDEARNRVIHNLLKNKDCLTKEEAEIKADLLLKEVEPLELDD